MSIISGTSESFVDIFAAFRGSIFEAGVAGRTYVEERVDANLRTEAIEEDIAIRRDELCQVRERELDAVPVCLWPWLRRSSTATSCRSSSRT